MKKWLWVLLPLLSVSLTSKSQTPTQANDQYLTVQFMGYADGKYEFKLTSNQTACSGRVDISISSTVNISKISPNAAGEFSLQNITITSSPYITYVTAPWNSNAVFTFKELTTCNWSGNPTALKVGVLLSSLPVTFTAPPKLEKVDDTHIKVTFSIGDVSGSNTLHIQLSNDGGKTWKDVSIILPESVKPNSSYSQIVTL